VAATYLTGALLGWRIAKHTDPNRLTTLLGLTLLALMPVLIYRSIAL